MLVETTHAYNIRSIGGKELEVKGIHDSRPEWDAEMVQAMLEKGAHPPLHEILRVVQRPHYKEMECIFIQPNGKKTSPMFLSMSIVVDEYPDTAKPFTR